MKKSKVIGVISIKGGVGKTTSVVNLGASLANDYGKSVLLIDGNLSGSNLGLHLGLVNPELTLHHVLKDEASVEDAIYKHSFGFSVLPASLVLEDADPMKLKQVVSKLRGKYDVILLDSSPTVCTELQAVMAASDQLFVVTSADYPTLLMTVRAVQMAKKKNVSITGLILNKQKGKDYEVGLREIEDYTGVPVVGVVRDTLKVHEALANMKPVVLHSKYNSASLEYRRLAAVLAGVKFKEPNIFVKAANYLKEDFDNFRTHKFTEAGFKYY